ncbi:hypothetical protein LOT_0645 [Lentilactobacillus otakiensis DSM 19908 = JCM 15040]|uniref:Uncharacterized protein n=1 Tax=Lentilactobacillus otakiensis DSM 19908 = JCM 15040 TaxID=1423780 RepID=S4NFW8_9LACO|nr:hypothetical protein LOT_0645 [Lentilactobacillus otakiensis DSM 19908 = JCM 15040]
MRTNWDGTSFGFVNWYAMATTSLSVVRFGLVFFCYFVETCSDATDTAI